MLADPRTRPQISASAESAGRRWQWLAELFAVDLRALAAVRIGVGLLLLLDVANRWPDLAAHYSDEGVLPRSARWALLVDFGLSGWTSLHMLSGAAWFQGMLFLATAAAACCLLVGYRTRVATVACFVLLFSLHARNPLVLQCGDTLLRCLLFWCLCLPLGAVWSIDAHRYGERPSAMRITSAGSVALLLQLCYVYLFTAILKTDPSWRRDFSAIYYALHHDHFTSRWGYALLNYPALLPPLTLASWLLEWAGPFLLFCPIATGRIRGTIVAAFIGFHLGLAVTMELGLFPYYCICYWLVFLPSSVWDRVDRMLLSVKHAGGLLVRTIHRNALAQFGRIQQGAMPTLAAGMLFRPITRTQRPRSPASVEWRPLRDSLVVFLLAYVTLLNLRRTNGDWFATIVRGPLAHVARATGLDQCWCMFATGPHEFGGWLVFRGTLADGREVNLWSPDEPLPQSKPALVSAMYPDHRWRRYLLYLHELPDEVQRRNVADYLRRRWEREHPSGPRVVRVELINMVQPTRPPQDDQSQPAPIKPAVLYRAEYLPADALSAYGGSE